jgi:polysaccharide biosynthesis transport protein
MNERPMNPITIGSGSENEQSLTQTLDLTNQLVEKVLGRQSQSGESEASLADYIELLLRRKWLFLGVFLATTAIALIFTFTRVPVYRSQALVEVDRLSKSTQDGVQATSSDQNFNKYFFTQVRLLTGRSLVEALLRNMSKDQMEELKKSSEGFVPWLEQSVAKRLAMSQTQGLAGPWGSLEASLERSLGFHQKFAFATSAKSEPDLVNVLQKRINVNPLTGTFLVEVSADATSPEIAQNTLNTYLHLFLSQNFDRIRQSNEQTNKWLKKELSEVEKRLVKSQNALVAFANKYGIVSLNSDPANHFMTFFEKSTDELIKAQHERTRLEAFRPDGYGNSVGGLVAPGFQKLKDELSSAEAEYTRVANIYSKNYPKVQLLEHRIKLLTATIEDLEKKSAANALQSARTEEKLLSDEFQKARAEAMHTNTLKAKYAILKKQIDTNDQLFKLLLKKSRETEVDTATLVNNIQVREKPDLPSKPFWPKRGLWAGVGICMGIGLGLVVALCPGTGDGRLWRQHDVERLLAIPCLGAIPKVPEFKKTLFNLASTRVDTTFLDHFNTGSRLGMALRNFHASLFTATYMAQCRVVAVTSALAGEGKSVVSILMAASFSGEGRRVLLVDADLRTTKPKIPDYLGDKKRHSKGLLDLLSGSDTSPHDVVLPTTIENLNYLVAGKIPRNTQQRLSKDRMTELLEECKNYYDVIIIDAAPVLAYPDVQILGGICDGLVVVAKAGQAPLATVQRAIRLASLSQARTLGMVMNFVG